MKKLLAALLALCMVVSLAPAVLAAGDDDTAVRETNVFSDYPHEDVNFEDMEYVPVTEEEFLAAIDDVEALIEADASVQEIEDAFHVVTDMMQTFSSDLNLLNILTSIDVTDEDSLELYLSTYDVYLACYDPFIYLIQDILDSKAADKIISDDNLTASDIEYYVNYGGMSDEEAALLSEISGIDSAYDQAANAGDLEGMVNVYMESIRLNKALAALYPQYDGYADYAYEQVFGRDYTPEEAETFFAAVKKYIVPLARQISYAEDYDLAQDPVAAGDLLYSDYTTSETLDVIRPYIGQLSSELLETWDYMIDHHLYDIEYRETKYDGGFTTNIPTYGAPFFFNSPYGEFYDFTTIVHEFGHYSNFYWHPHTWNDGTCSFDVGEVHSQALELLFSSFYEDIFGDAANIAMDELLNNMVIGGILNGALVAELELYAYSTPDVTIDMINEKFLEIAHEYGLKGYDYAFIGIPHMTQSPFYYISYATSAIGALTFWNIAQEEGLDTAVDQYLAFMACPYYDAFQDQFMDICGVNPMDPEYIAEIAKNVSSILNLEERAQDGMRMYYFDDVDMDAWYYEYVCTAYENDIMSGISDSTFSPESRTKRAEAVTAICNLLGSEAPEQDNFKDTAGTWYTDYANWAYENGIIEGMYGSFNGEAKVTREQVALMLYNAAAYLELDTSVSDEALPFADADKIDSWAEDALVWCVDNAIFEGSGNHLNPTSAIQRGELAKVLVVFAQVAAAQLADAQ